MINKSHKVIDALREAISNIDKSEDVTTIIELPSRLFLSSLSRDKEGSSYKVHALPESENDVLLYWIDDKYDEIEDRRVLHHYKSDIKLVYQYVKADEEKGIQEQNNLYIKVDAATVDEEENFTLNRETYTVAPHVEVIVLTVYDVGENGFSEVIDKRVVGYKVSDVDVILSELQSDWISHQLIGNLLYYESEV